MNHQPNIVVWVAHDIGRHLGCYGVESVVTPHMDGLAAEGVRCTGYFSTAPQCSPARASLFTGRYPHNHGVVGICSETFGFDLHQDEQHLSTLLAAAGYETVLAGFQQETLRPDTLPLRRLPANGHSAHEVGTSIAQFLKTRGPEAAPFYVQAGCVEAHRPFNKCGAEPFAEQGVWVPEWLRDTADARADFAAFQGALKALDAGVGLMLQALADAGLKENTIVLVISDHGIPFARAKHSLYEPGCAAAALWRWPAGGWTGGQAGGQTGGQAGGQAGGRVVEAMISGVDVLPTLVEAAGLTCSKAVQGRSIDSLLKGRDDEGRTYLFTEQSFNAYTDVGRAVRDDRHKLIANFSPGRCFYDSSQLWRPLSEVGFIADQPRSQHPPLELYDLRADPLEMRNLVGTPQSAGTEERLCRVLFDWMRDTDDPLLRGFPEPPLYQRTLGKLQAAGRGTRCS